MAVIVETDNPEILWTNFVSMIQQGKISTWIMDIDGDLTIRNPAWTSKAWFTLSNEPTTNQLRFGIITSTKFPMTKELYGVYHGRLAATLLANFDDCIRNISITSNFLEGTDIYG